MQSRTHTCGELRITDAGKKVQLSGWMENFREVGAELGFVVIRDFYGTTQIVIETAEMMKTLKLYSGIIGMFSISSRRALAATSVLS